MGGVAKDAHAGIVSQAAQVDKVPGDRSKGGQ